MSKSDNKYKLNNLSVKILWLLSFGMFGTQMAFALESSQLGRLFQTIGASPNLLGILFIIPPITGLFCQPIIGKYSDKTWIPHFGRRIPYLVIGTVFTILTLIALPNVGNFNWGSNTAVIVASIIVFIFMIASNVCVQPYKMLVGDLVNDKQQGQAFSIQSFLLNSGSVLATFLPFLLTILGIKNTAKPGQIPQSVSWTFYIAAIAIAISSLITVMNVREVDPETFRNQHDISDNKKSKSMIQLLKEAPKIFWSVALVQFFAFFAFGYLWIYGNGFIANNIYKTLDATTEAYQKGGNLFGILSAVYALSALVTASIFLKFKTKNYKKTFAISLLIGSLGYLLAFFTHQITIMVIAFGLIGVGWASITIFPLTMVTSSVSKDNLGTYLGLFNSQVCIPQILGSILSIVILPIVGGVSQMIFLSSIFMLFASLSVFTIKYK
ncbi:MFS transporter [Lactobacillus sp. S2-2]|uniref:MFS transporter n=1 Tax=Lactobacillus sp. S2-2 TaxID=2692917 RepID=UPI001F02DDEE|nr:MFS transporter [Lactobacillus sp. S2-2]MCF6514574.1 MFS transporter [Lactobacillus sp. S2-2]